MKNLIITALLLVGMTSFAQERYKMEKSHHGHEMEKFTPDQRNELMLKKMTLELDLSAKQQAQMKSIIAEKNANHESMMKARKDKKEKMTRDERFAMKNKMLDHKIEMKAKMKSILSPEQFEKWDAKKDKREKRKSHRMHKKMSDKMEHKKDSQK